MINDKWICISNCFNWYNETFNKADQLFIESTFLKEFSALQNTISIENRNGGNSKEINNIQRVTLKSDIDEIKNGLYMLGLDFLKSTMDEFDNVEESFNKEIDDWIEVKSSLRKGIKHESKMFFSPSHRK